MVVFKKRYPATEILGNGLECTNQRNVTRCRNTNDATPLLLAKFSHTFDKYVYFCLCNVSLAIIKLTTFDDQMNIVINDIYLTYDDIYVFLN